MLLSATKSRKKQKAELVRSVIQAEEEKRRRERENFHITSVPVLLRAAYEPSLFSGASEDHEDGKKLSMFPMGLVGLSNDNDSIDEELADQEKSTASKPTMHMAQTLFPSVLCTAFVEVINLLDDHAVSLDGTAVYEVAFQVRTKRQMQCFLGSASSHLIMTASRVVKTRLLMHILLRLFGPVWSRTATSFSSSSWSS